MGLSSVFTDVESEMCGLEWDDLYAEYHKKSYNPAKVSAECYKGLRRDRRMSKVVRVF